MCIFLIVKLIFHIFFDEKSINMSNHIDQIISDLESNCDFEDTWENKYDDVVSDGVGDDEFFGKEYGVGEGENENVGLVNEINGLSNTQTYKHVLEAGNILKKELCALRENERKKEKERELEKEKKEKLANDVQKVMSLVNWASTTKTGAEIKTKAKRIKLRSTRTKQKEFPSLNVSRISAIKTHPKHEPHIPGPTSGKIIEKFSLFNISYREEKKIIALASIENTTQEDQLLTRTKMCRSVKIGTPCPHGENCNFAHSEEELMVKKCMHGNSCNLVVYENGKIENNYRRDKICTFIHPSEEKSNYNVRISENHILLTRTRKDTEEKLTKDIEERIHYVRIGEVKTKVVLKKGKKVQRKVEDTTIEKTESEKKTPEEYKKAKEEREKRAISRFSELQRLKNERRDTQETILKLDLDLNSESAAFYCSGEWDTPPVSTSTPTPTPTQAQSIIPSEIETPKPIETITQSIENYKSNAICRTVNAGGQCPYGNRCKFAHVLEEFNPFSCKFGRECRFILFDDKTNTFINNPINDRACPFKHNNETRENYFNRVKIYDHIPMSKNVTKPIQKPLGPQIIEHKIIHKTSNNAWIEPPKVETPRVEPKPTRIIEIPKEAKCLKRKPTKDLQTTYNPDRIKILTPPIETPIEPKTSETPNEIIPTHTTELTEPKHFQNVHIHLHLHLQNKHPNESNTTIQELEPTPETPKRASVKTDKIKSSPEMPQVPKSPEKFIPTSSPAEKLTCHRQMSHPSPHLIRHLVPLFSELPTLVSHMTSPKTPQAPTKPRHNLTFENIDRVSRKLDFD